MSWTEERITLLQQLWSDGLSASQIASRLGGVTRNAVIGKVHRLGLSDKSRTKAGNHRGGKATAQTAAPAATAKPTETAESASVTSLSEARAAKEANVEANVEVNSDATVEASAAGTTPDAPASIAPAPINLPSSGPTAVPGRPTEPVRTQAEQVVVASAPAKGSIGILELTEQTCRWPFGDPTKPGFHFCGAHSSAGEVYCSDHAKVAFQPVEARRRR